MLERMLEREEISGRYRYRTDRGQHGIGLAIAAQQLGLEAIFVVPERFSVENNS